MKILTKSNSNKKDNDLRKLYNTLRNKVTKMIRKTKADHFQNKVEEHKDKPSPLWKQLQTIGYSNKSKEKSRIVLEIDNEKCILGSQLQVATENELKNKY